MKRVKQNMKTFMLSVLLTAVAYSCSTTKNLPEGGTLYTGIERINYIIDDSITVDDDVLDMVDAAFAYPPNNALLGSSTTRTPVPFGLWVYNANVNKKSGINKWMMNWLAKKPVLISVVKPDTRIKIAQNIMRDNGYFDGNATYEIIPDKKDNNKAKIRYDITFNKPYTLDSVEYRRMQSRGDTLLNLNEANRLLRKNDIFNAWKLEAERQRISTIMRDNGYYYFRPEYISYQGDTTLSTQKISLRVGMKQGIPRSIITSPWKIGDISIFIGGYDNETPTDSVYYKDILIRYEGKLRVRPSILYDQIHFKTGELYSLSKQIETQRSINRMDIFRFTEIQHLPKDTLETCDTMNVSINMSYDYPLNGTIEVKGITGNNDYAGPGASLNLTRRNLFGGGEVLTASVYGSYEWYTGNAYSKSSGVVLNNYEIGAKSNIMFPRLVLPRIGKRAYDFSATSRLEFDVSALNRARFYKTLSFGGSLSYDFLPNPIRHHSFTPFKLVFNKLQNTTADFDENINPSLFQSLQDQFIPSIEYAYTLDNSSRREERSKTWWRLSVSEAGNFVSGFHMLFGKKFNDEKQILRNHYAQFFKLTTELRYNHYIDRNQKLATRIGGGIIYSYGNSKIAPYNERFYVGGANSIRAFTIRSVGPGRFIPNADDPYAYIDQNGDFKIEGNIEYRGRLVGDLDIAIFIDAGNVWLLRRDDTRPGGTFALKHLLNDIALGTGIGFRYDIDMLVFRFDIGYGLHFPYNTGKSGYFNAPSFGDALGFHLALGYPF